ncbi:CDP-diacylglycerol--glycerol-3-phosphate 3-phosphatidyltransferase 1, chloroplastic, partial [Linum grandiflorum]
YSSSSSSTPRGNCDSAPKSAAGLSAGSAPSSSSGLIAEDMGSDSDHINGFDQPSRDHHNRQCSAKLLTLPTILTLGRVASVPLLIFTFYMDTWLGRTATTSIFVAAAVTDWLDGYIARKMRLGSAFGAFLDPVADKLMVAATLVLLCTRPLDIPLFGSVSWLLTVPSIAIIGREITMSAVREWAASQSTKLLEAVAVNNLGKWKTATQMTALTILIATRDGGGGSPGALVACGVILLYISAGLSVWSLGVYTSKIWKVLLK